jgi:hypothetical protein
MGKISEVLKRAQNVSGTVMVEVGSTKQQAQRRRSSSVRPPTAKLAARFTGTKFLLL